MFNSIFLDLVISLVFVYFLLSMLVSGISELIITLSSKRAKDLQKAIDEVFNDRQNKNWSELLYTHPLIDRLKRTDKKLPAYISAQTFAATFIDLMINEAKEKKMDSITTPGETTFTETLPSDNPYINFTEGVKKLNPSDAKILLQTFITESKDVDTLKKTIEKWYDDYMERVSGWFKRDMQKKLFWISLVVTIALNVDSVHLTKSLWKDKSMREMVVNTAVNYVEKENNNSLADTSYDTSKTKSDKNLNAQIEYIDSIYSEIDAFKLPIGWPSCKKTMVNNNDDGGEDGFWMSFCNFLQGIWDWIIEQPKCLYVQIITITFVQIIGWLISAFAISFGAPFWFDALCKLVNMRGTGSKPKVVGTNSK